MMDYDEAITAALAMVRQDKRIMQPWRNKAAAQLEEAQAFIRMGLTSTNRTNPEGLVHGSVAGCTCQPGVSDTSCPVHGIGSRLRRPTE